MGGLKPVRVVEAVTPNSACVVRVRALPLTGGLAGALDGRPELLRRVLVDGEGRDGVKEDGSNGAGECRRALGPAGKDVDLLMLRQTKRYLCNRILDMTVICGFCVYMCVHMPTQLPPPPPPPPWPLSWRRCGRSWRRRRGRPGRCRRRGCSSCCRWGGAVLWNLSKGGWVPL